MSVEKQFKISVPCNHGLYVEVIKEEKELRVKPKGENVDCNICNSAIENLKEQIREKAKEKGIDTREC